MWPFFLTNFEVKALFGLDTTTSFEYKNTDPGGGATTVVASVSTETAVVAVAFAVAADLLPLLCPAPTVLLFRKKA